MDVSNREQPNGEELIDQIVSLTGLPQPLVHEELRHILQHSKQVLDSEGPLTLDQLREAMLAYLEELNEKGILCETASDIDS